MNFFETVFLSLFAVISLLVFAKGLHETKNGRVYHEPRFFIWMGIFVWGDAVVFGLFWFLVCFAILFLFKSWILFLLIISMFYLVRSVGETIYWLNQQFSTITRNSPKNLIGRRLFHDDSIWFVYQIAWQCITVITAIATIYLTALWIKTV